MSEPEIHIDGILHADGTLQLDHRPQLPAGQVGVTIRSKHDTAVQADETWWQYLQRVRGEMEAEGVVFWPGEVIDAEIEQMRHGDD